MKISKRHKITGDNPKYIWYCAELDSFKILSFVPYLTLSVPGWEEYIFFTFKGLDFKTFNKLGLVEYIYIGEL